MQLKSVPTVHSKDSGPWSYQPICTEPLDKMDGAPLAIYTNTRFNSGNGISIVTTPELSEAFATLPSLADPEGFSETFSPTDPNSAIYTPRLTVSGSTMLAQKNYECGDHITSELPLIVTINENILSWEEREEILQVAVGRLPIETQEKIKGMASHFDGPESIFKLPPLVGIVATNAGLPIEVAGRGHFAMYPPTFSTLNFGCSPNTQFRIDPETLLITLRASRNIPKGEELSTSYYLESQREVHFLPFGERQWRISQYHFFLCSCARCKLDDTTDSALQELREFQKKLEGENSSLSVDDALKLIHLYQKEGLDAFLDNPYGIAATAFDSIGDNLHAKKYATLAIKTRSRFNGVVLNTDEKIHKWKEMVKEY